MAHHNSKPPAAPPIQVSNQLPRNRCGNIRLFSSGGGNNTKKENGRNIRFVFRSQWQPVGSQWAASVSRSQWAAAHSVASGSQWAGASFATYSRNNVLQALAASSLIPLCITTYCYARLRTATTHYHCYCLLLRTTTYYCLLLRTRGTNTSIY